MKEHYSKDYIVDFIMEESRSAKMKIRRIQIASLILSILLLLIFGAYSSLKANDIAKGRIIGRLVDAETGEPLIGANVFLEDTMIGAASDLNGKFDIKSVPPGKYNLMISIIGYAKKKLTDVKVPANKIVKLDVTLEPEVLVGEDVVVVARMLKNTEASLLKERQKAAAVSDAISAEDFSRAGLGDAAIAMGHVTGVSTIAGKYIYIRGLGERYSTTQLNGAVLPSADPEKRAVQLDLFPTNLLDNIVTVKTATPDKPGNFTGGSVNIATKTFPESFTMSFSSSTGFNSQTTLKNSFLTYPGGKKDWLGMDDGTRDIPSVLKDPSFEIPDIGSAFTDADKAKLLDEVSKSFKPVMSPSTKTAPINQSYAFSIGNQFELLGRPLGFVGSFSYKRNLSNYDDGISGRWQLTGKVSEVDELNNDFLLFDSRSEDEALWGSLVNLNFKPHRNHELGANFLYNRGGK
ncbi:MAG: carboxypeptidase-like regulatory domain-containing protein, partial [bacterium]